MELVGTNLDMIKNNYRLFKSGAIAQLLDTYHDDVVVNYYGHALMPLTGNYEGKMGAIRFFQMIPELVEIFLFEPREFFDAGNAIIVIGREGVRSHKTGKSYEGDFIHVSEIADGKVKRLRLYPDTAKGASIYTT